jgi:hypothetical protein
MFQNFLVTTLLVANYQKIIMSQIVRILISSQAWMVVQANEKRTVNFRMFVTMEADKECSAK